MEFDATETLIDAFRNGEIVIIVDDENRENEGDLIASATGATPETINFMITHGRGLVCVPMMPDRAAALELDIPNHCRHDKYRTAFTQSVDAIAGNTTGISAYDRARTVAKLLDQSSSANDFFSPGHMFPLIARPGGILERQGHTEAVVELARLAGLPPMGILCEIINDDGTMARVPDLHRYRQKHGLKMGTIADLLAYVKKLA